MHQKISKKLLGGLSKLKVLTLNAFCFYPPPLRKILSFTPLPPVERKLHLIHFNPPPPNYEKEQNSTLYCFTSWFLILYPHPIPFSGNIFKFDRPP